jgi:hypothetical protein
LKKEGMMIKVVVAPDLRIGVIRKDIIVAENTNLGQDPYLQNTSTRNIEEIIDHDLGMKRMIDMVDMTDMKDRIEEIEEIEEIDVVERVIEVEMMVGERDLTQKKR